MSCHASIAQILARLDERTLQTLVAKFTHESLACHVAQCKEYLNQKAKIVSVLKEDLKVKMLTGKKKGDVRKFKKQAHASIGGRGDVSPPLSWSDVACLLNPR